MACGVMISATEKNKAGEEDVEHPRWEQPHKEGDAGTRPLLSATDAPVVLPHVVSAQANSSTPGLPLFTAPALLRGLGSPPGQRARAESMLQQNESPPHPAARMET